MTWKEISIISKKGWEIGSHTMNHYILTALSPQRLDEELFLSKKVLKENGYDAISVSYPGGITDHKVVEVARKYYQIGRVAIDLGHWNPIVNTGIVNRFALKSFTLSEKTFSEVGLKTLLNDLRKQGGWGIFLIHSVVDLVTRERDHISIDNFKKILEIVKESGIQVMTLTEVYQSFSSSFSSDSSIANYDDKAFYWQRILRFNLGYVAYLLTRNKTLGQVAKKFLFGNEVGQRILGLISRS